jgi:hypothetical protein
MTRRPGLAAAALLAALAAAEARAQTAVNFRTGNWVGQVVFQDNRFSHCEINVNYRGGNVDKANLVIQANANRAIAIGVTKPDWNMNPASKYDIVFSLGAYRRTVQGKVNQGKTNQIWFVMGDDADFRAAVATGGTLEMADSGGQKFPFSMANGDNALRKLYTCVALYGVD